MQHSGPRLFAVLGHPISHSLSPLMHNAAFRELGLNCRYEALDVDIPQFPAAIRRLIDSGYEGLNITIPLKQAAYSLVNEIDTEARQIGAINTVMIEGGKLSGFNTDSFGLLKSLEPFKSQIKGSACLILGAGGAARAAAFVLNSYFAPKRISFASRSPDRAKVIAESLQLKNAETLRPFDASTRGFLESFSLIVNATPVGMYPTIDVSPVPGETVFHNKQIVFDLIYRPLETKLLRQARLAGAACVSGLEMFLHQGARAFELWTGNPMPIEPVRKAVTDQLRGELVGERR